MKNIKSYLITCRVSLFTAVTAATFMMTGCHDDIFYDSNGTESDNAISFTVTDVQDIITNPQTQKKAFASPEAFKAILATQDLKMSDISADYTPMQVPGHGTMYLSSATFPAIDTEMKHPGTRAEISDNIYSAFYTIGFKGNNEHYTLGTPWFYKAETESTGRLKKTEFWDSENPWTDFYAITAQNTSARQEALTEQQQLTISPADHTGTPYIDFTVNTDAQKQVDLLTAYSGRQHYIPGQAPRPKLNFFHALTAVRFKIGPNLSWGKTIEKVEITGAKSKGHFTLPTDASSNGTWSDQKDPTTFTLLTDKSTDGVKGQLLLGENGQNNTFYMLPQKIDGIKFIITCKDGTVIRATPKGEWKAGTTKTYSITQNKSNWVYVMDSSSPQVITWDQSQSKDYSIRSFRVFVNHTDGKEDTVRASIQPVPWKLVGYQNQQGKEISKPSWLEELKITQDPGSYEQKLSFAKVKSGKQEQANWLEMRNDKLQNAPALGSESTPYDLSTYGGTKPRTTANCYVVSAQGWYCLPLVYGNAITNGQTNQNAYVSTLDVPDTDKDILKHFVDHAGVAISDPWITKTNNGTYKPDGASLVWADTDGIIDPTSIQVTEIGGEKYLKFQILNTLSNGNVVVAVKQGNTVLWSWQLWAAPQEVLNTIPNQNQKGNLMYDVAYETLGYKYTKWYGTSYRTPRTVKVVLQQDDGQRDSLASTTVTLTQLPGFTSEGYSTLYQFGRKDAFPGTDTILQGTIKFETSPANILYATTQNPGTFYLNSTGWEVIGSTWTTNRHYYNIWGDNSYVSELPVKYKTLSSADNVKTVYDPCPPGFKVPMGDAFSGFVYPYNKNEPRPKDVNPSVDSGKGGENFIRNASPWQNGYFFYNKNENPDEVLWFPLTTHREGGIWWKKQDLPAGEAISLNHGGGEWARYWNCNVGLESATDTKSWGGMYLDFGNSWIDTADKNWFECGQAIRPVKDAAPVPVSTATPATK